MADIFERRRILVCVGSGGVGKTTTAAALALRAALGGRKTLVLTIDPARRLANSLGLDGLGHTIQQVTDERLELAAAELPGRRVPGGELHAMMLDQKKAFDEIVETHASDAEAVQRILANPVYSQISGSLAGAHEYAAMAKLYQISQERDYDLIVVDTPPTAHALDFLDAPQKVADAIDSPAVEWFAKPFKATGRLSLR
ncbi:MAG: AAA family ATPase, partial [Deltaproteobacteria bacterium]|nr:AAA family ATPase [Deltaproteobacteria bacterium]